MTQWQQQSKFGTASKTITLDLGAWAKLYDACELAGVGLQVGLMRSIAVFHAQVKKSEAMSSIPNIEKED